MNKLQIKQLQDTIQGQHYNEALLKQAISEATTTEIKLLLIALRYGYPINTHSRMVLQDFVVELSHKDPAEHSLS